MALLLLGLLSSLGLLGGAVLHSYGDFLERGGAVTPRMEALVNRTAASIAAALDAEVFVLDGEEEDPDGEASAEHVAALTSSLQAHLREGLTDVLQEPEGFVLVDMCATRWKLVALANAVVWVASAAFMALQHVFLGPPRDPTPTVSESWGFISFNLLVVVFLLDPSPLEAPVWVLWFAVTGVAWLLSTAALRKMKESADGAAGVLPKGPLVLAGIGLLVSGVVVYALVGLLAPLVTSLALLLVADWVVIAVTWAEALAIWAIEAHHSRVPGGWSYQTEARVIARLVLEGTAHVVTLVHIAHVWLMHGSVVLSLFNMALISAAQSTLSKAKTLTAMYGALSTLYRHLNRSFKEATQEQLLAPEEESSSSSSSAGEGSSSGPPKPAALKECAICLEPMAAAKVLPRCGHIFHKTCIKRWLLGGHGTCPVCRAGFTEEIEERERAAAARREAAARAREAGAARQAAPVVVAPPPGAAAAAGGGHQAPAGGPIALPRPVLEAQAGEGAAAAALSSLLRQLLPPAAPVPLTDPRVATLVEMFPSLPAPALAYHLGAVARGNMDATIEAALEGRVRPDVPAGTEAGAGQAPPAAAAEAAASGAEAAPPAAPPAVDAPLPPPSALQPVVTAPAPAAREGSSPLEAGLGSAVAGGDGLRRRRPADGGEGSHEAATAGDGSSFAPAVPDTPEVARAKRLAAIERRLGQAASQ